MSILGSQTKIDPVNAFYAPIGGGGGNGYIPETNVIIPAPATNSYGEDPLAPGGQTQIFQINTNDIQGLRLYNADVYLNNFNFSGATPVGGFSLYLSYSRNTPLGLVVVYSTIVNQYYDHTYPLVYFPVRAIIPFTLGDDQEYTNLEMFITNTTDSTLDAFDYTIQNITNILISNQFSVL